MTAPTRGPGLPPRTTNWATYDAWFASEPRTPAEVRQHEQAREAWEQRARKWHAAEVNRVAERYGAAMKVADLVRANMANMAQFGHDADSLERHLSALDAAEREIARARAEAHAIVDEMARLSSGDPVTLYQQFLARFPAMASRVAIGDLPS
jgi:hypothetical protein